MQTDNNERKAALYVRVSTDEQAEKGTSLATQEERLREFCSRQGIGVAGLYVDDGYSGATLDRPNLQRLLEDARKGLFNVVLVYKLDRLSRNLKDAVNLVLGELESQRIGFQSITEPFNTLEPAGRVMFANLASFADYEREQIRERCVRGRLMRNREGKYTGGGLPYGVAWNNEKRCFSIVENEARVLRLIFDLFVYEGLGVQQIARRLAELGYVTRSGAAFDYTHIGFLLRSSAASGEWHRHRITYTPTFDPTVQRNLLNQEYDKKAQRPRDEWITVPVPPIVSREVWDRAQEILASRAKPRSSPKPRGLCVGLIFCGVCGNRVGVKEKSFPSKRRRMPYYGCYSRIHKGDRRYPRYQRCSCSLPFIPTQEVDDAVWRKVEELISRPETLWDTIYGQKNEHEDKAADKLEELKRQLAQAKIQEERSARLFTMGVDASVAQKQLQEAVARRRTLQKEYAEAQRAQTKCHQQQDQKEQAFATLMTLRNRLENLTLETKREILRTLIPGGLTYRIDLQKDRTVDIRGILPLDPEGIGLHYPASSYFK